MSHHNTESPNPLTISDLMQNDFRYDLDKSSRKFTCPQCEKKRFVKYIDLETKLYLPDQYGRCDRQAKCGYFLDPYKDGYAKSHTESIPYRTNRPSLSTPYKKQPLTPIPKEILDQTIRNGYDLNIFIQNLLHRVPYPFDLPDIEAVISMYGLGTVAHGYRKGAVTMPFIDHTGQTRFIQVKNFDYDNHTTGTDSLTSMLTRYYQDKGQGCPEWLNRYNQNELKVSCLFGAHLLPMFPENRIALVEAPKTAIYGSLYFGLPKGPEDLLWMAVYSRDTLTVEKCRALEGRTVYLFPDLSEDGSTYDKWRDCAAKISGKVKGLRFVVSDFLEKVAGVKDKERGLDLADYLIDMDWREFRTGPVEKEITPGNDPPAPIDQGRASDVMERFEPLSPEVSPGSWDGIIFELEQFFEGRDLPTEFFKLNPYTPISDCRAFVDVNLTTAKANNGVPAFRPYLDRVVELRDFLDDKKECDIF